MRDSLPVQSVHTGKDGDVQPAVVPVLNYTYLMKNVRLTHLNGEKKKDDKLN